MTSGGHPARSPSFLVALLRRGAPVIAATPDDLPDRAVDPTPMPGWQRISMMSVAAEAAVADTLLMRACRYVVLVPLLYRIAVLPPVLLAFVSVHGLADIAPVLVTAVVSVLLNVFGAAWVLRVTGFRDRVARVLLSLDAAVALLLNLVVSATMPAASHGAATQVSWTYLIGSVGLWTLAWGVPAGVALVAASVPLQVAMSWSAGDAVRYGFAATLGNTLELVVAMVTAVGGLVLVGLGSRLALGVGIRRGREAERARAQRNLHDTVLQTLEVLAMSLPGDAEHAPERLVELRRVARAQVLQLRRSLDESADGATPSSLGEDLAGLATEMAREGLRAQLVIADVDDDTLSEVRRLAVRDAVREALRNTVKHAGTLEVVLRVEEQEGGIAVIARDYGVGFAEEDRPPGFGISNSIAARLAEVGGTARVDSRPGRGTRVTLWVPR
ncbi:ATP-binding protein [Solihabitans fulvus]|uniref:ATP-binding protein n=1 Tax=Solihabitans fulvus TaxID=1892852 RepID=A0A5B2XUH5_9PSEU|nr:ATP-binding protein [Solihabitans fulvus]KAA2266464.1 ATP-binding protein [Solihabitans fulvus]